MQVKVEKGKLKEKGEKERYQSRVICAIEFRKKRVEKMAHSLTTCYCYLHCLTGVCVVCKSRY